MKKDDTCWIIENGRQITFAKILSFSGNLCLLRLDSGQALRVPLHRLYESLEAAENALPKRERKYNSPYDYI